MFQKLLPILFLLSACAPAHAATAMNVFLQYSTATVSNTSYTQISAGLPFAVQHLNVFDSSGQAMNLAFGPPGSEVTQMIIPPGGGDFPLNISAGVKVSIQSSTANATTGLGIFNFFFN